MIDEIDYFPKRDKYGKKKGVDEEWDTLKKIKTSQDAKTKSGKKSDKGNRDRKKENPGK